MGDIKCAPWENVSDNIKDKRGEYICDEYETFLKRSFGEKYITRKPFGGDIDREYQCNITVDTPAYFKDHPST